MEENSINIEKTVAALLEQKKYFTLRDVFITLNPADIAVLMVYLKR